jgi:hypothetical protein
MAFVAAATGVGAAVLGTGAAAGIGSTLVGGALIGAGIGGLYSGITGDGNILNSMLTGGLIGGAAGGIGGALFPGAAGYAPAATSVGLNPALAAGAPSTAAVPTSNVVTGTAAQGAGYGLKGAGSASQIAAQQSALGLGSAAAPGASTFASFVPTVPKTTATQLATNLGGKAAASALTGKQVLGYGLAGTTAMQLLDGRKGGIPVGGTQYPGDIRPYEYSARPAGMADEAMYPTTQYDMAGNPVLDTRERTYFDQSMDPLQAYKAGTANPNPVMAAQGGLMAAYPMEKYGPSMSNTEIPMSYMAEGGEVEMDERRRKAIMKNIKGASTERLENILGSMNQQEFLMKNMPNYAAAMAPSISGMVEGAQYGDRMSKSFNDMAKANALKSGQDFQDQPQNYARVMPTMVDPQSGMYGGIASIGRQIDPQTRVNAMANLQRTPYDRNAMEAVRRLGVGVDRQLGKDTNLSAFYEQDPMGRDKMGGVRLSQRFAKGGMSDLGGYSDGGRMLKGPGDGMSDNIPGVIGGKQPARLADGEFVVPADVVSHLGNGSTDAGAKRLYAMMDTVRKARTGTKKQGKQIKAEKYLPA